MLINFLSIQKVTFYCQCVGTVFQCDETVYASYTDLLLPLLFLEWTQADVIVFIFPPSVFDYSSPNCACTDKASAELNFAHVGFHKLQWASVWVGVSVRGDFKIAMHSTLVLSVCTVWWVYSLLLYWTNLSVFVVWTCAVLRCCFSVCLFLECHYEVDIFSI